MSETTRGLLFAAFLMLFSAGCTAAAMSTQNVPSKGTNCILKEVSWPMWNVQPQMGHGYNPLLGV